MGGKLDNETINGNIVAGSSLKGELTNSNNLNGEIVNGNINGNITDDRDLIGTLSNDKGITALMNPITVKATKNYNVLINKPRINEVELIDNKNLEDLNVTRLTNSEIEDLINSIII